MRRRRADGRLFDGIAALCAAASRAALAKRRGPGPAAFLANLETEVLALERELRAGTWRPGGYVSFEIRDPKRRMISAAPFRDTVVHHAVHAVIAPLFERGFIEHTYANRAGKGTHRAQTRYERLRDRHRYVLRGDIFRYFPAIDHEVLKADLRRRIACRRTLTVLDRIVDASNPHAPVNLLLPGRRPVHAVRAPPGTADRQPDELALRQRVPRPLRPLRHRGAPRAVLALRGRLRVVRRTTRPGSRRGASAWRRFWRAVGPAKTHVAATSAPATFLGFELLPSGRRRLPEANLRGGPGPSRGRWSSGFAPGVAHAAHADTWRLRRAIFRDGWFAPRGQPVPGA